MTKGRSPKPSLCRYLLQPTALSLENYPNRGILRLAVSHLTRSQHMNTIRVRFAGVVGVLASLAAVAGSSKGW
jgi:hypothetical protein